MRASALHIVAFPVFGPIAAAVYGVFEITLLYLLVLIVPPSRPC